MEPLPPWNDVPYVAPQGQEARRAFGGGWGSPWQ